MTWVNETISCQNWRRITFRCILRRCEVNSCAAINLSSTGGVDNKVTIEEIGWVFVLKDEVSPHLKTD